MRGFYFLSALAPLHLRGPGCGFRPRRLFWQGHGDDRYGDTVLSPILLSHIWL